MSIADRVTLEFTTRLGIKPPKRIADIGMSIWALCQVSMPWELRGCVRFAESSPFATTALRATVAVVSAAACNRITVDCARIVSIAMRAHHLNCFGRITASSFYRSVSRLRRRVLQQRGHVSFQYDIGFSIWAWPVRHLVSAALQGGIDAD